MTKINLENVICWEYESNGDGILCPECMGNEFPEYPSNWKPILSIDDNTIYECDCCGERITE